MEDKKVKMYLSLIKRLNAISDLCNNKLRFLITKKEVSKIERSIPKRTTPNGNFPIPEYTKGVNIFPDCR